MQHNITTQVLEYGWVQDISEIGHSALPQTEINVREGSNIDLNIFFLENGPSNRDKYHFRITTRGTALGKTHKHTLLRYILIVPTENVDYIISHGSVLKLTNQPIPVNVLTVDDDVYEGTKIIILRLLQINSTNNVTYSLGFISETVVITVEDNDSMLNEAFVFMSNHKSN